jgi:isorenieratene synthase
VFFSLQYGILILDTNKTYPVIIVGGGLAGLTAALHLAERGITPLILEADPVRAGGRVSGGEIASLPNNGTTATVNNKSDSDWSFPGEHGIHAVWGEYHNFRAFLARHGIDPGYVPSRREWWVHRPLGGRVQWAEGGSALRQSWIPAPFHYMALFVRPRFLQMLTLRDLASMFRVLGSLWFALGFDPAAGDDALRNLTLADFFRGWSPTVQALFAGLARNFASARPELVPQGGFVAFLRFYTLLRRDSWAFTYFKQDGGTALIAPLLARLNALGGEIQLGTRVERLERMADGGWRVLWPDGEAVAAQVIMALDSAAARQLLTTNTDTEPAAQSLSWPMTIPTAVFRFWFSRSPQKRAEAGIFTGDFTLDNFFWLDQFQTVFADWHTATGGSVVECHIYGPIEALDQPDAVLLARGVLDLQRVWPELRGTVVMQTILRNPTTHTLFGTSGPSLAVETPWPNLSACGDWVRYPHPSLYMERSVATGIAAANRVLVANKLAEWPIQQPKRPEPPARAIQAMLHRVRKWAGKG